jgi:hypothetical protein
MYSIIYAAIVDKFRTVVGKLNFVSSMLPGVKHYILRMVFFLHSNVQEDA